MSEAVGAGRGALGKRPAARVVNIDHVLKVEPSKFTEVERIAHVSSVRDALDAISNTKRPPPELLAKKIKLLRLWCELVKLRVSSVRSNTPPPEHTPVPNRRGKSNAKLELPTKITQTRQAQVDKTQAPPVNMESEALELRLLEASMVGGVMLPAGANIQVGAEDAEELLKTKMAIRAT